MFFAKFGLLSPLLIAPLIDLGAGAPSLLTTPLPPTTPVPPSPVGPSPLPPSPTTTTLPPTTPAPSAAFGCLHAADPDGAQGYCPAVAATGWCVCSDSSTYGIETGFNPCGYTAPPASGPTTLASTGCVSSTSSAPSVTTSSIGRTKCSQAECPKYCDVGISTTKRSLTLGHGHLGLNKRFYENNDPDQFPYLLLSQSYTTNICPSANERNTYFWRGLETQRRDYAAALEGLCGCTTIFVASGKGVFSSHIWESDEKNTPPRDLQPANLQATLQDLQNALSPHSEDLAGGEAFLIIPTDPDGTPSPDNPNNYLYGVHTVNAIKEAINTASGGIQPTVVTYDPLDFVTSGDLGEDRRGTASFEFDPAYRSSGQTGRAYRIISEGRVLSLKTGL